MQTESASTFFPMFMDLSCQAVLVVGGGRIATRRVLVMEPFAPNLTVAAPEVSSELRALAEDGRIALIESAWSESMLDGADIVLACTDDSELNGSIFNACRQRGILVNNCSDHGACDFYFPGVVRRGNFVVAVNASGRDHVRAKELRERIQALLEEYDG